MSAVATIPLTRGMEAIVSAEDIGFADKKWYAGTVSRTTTYAMRVEVVDGRRKAVYLHRLIAGAGPGQLVDHANRNTLDNRRENLRLATRQMNCVNRADYTSASGFRGVFKSGDGWRAAITAMGAITRSKKFAAKEDAARAYDAMAVKHFGQFAVLNFPGEARS